MPEDEGRWWHRPGGRRHGVRVFVLILVVLSAMLVGLSPLALDSFGGSATSWARRGTIGETYGAAAALLSVLALAGIAASLVLQAREMMVSREQAARAVHTDLLKMAMDDPAYLECWGPYSSSADQTEQRQYLYVNLILSYWESRYELGQLTDVHLRAGASRLFQAQPGLRFWGDTRSLRVETAEGRRARRFHRILDEEYLKAVTRSPQP
ncbi:MAG: hypothetical protein JWO67_7090 [Streptosporangiaceae bacterium]|nr:hypothetical protein [Streptosporangiaceae bacterium]